ncbi:MAG TPA: formylglycine-generating enzyme family protein [bacterium]|nr:formylglycine-generating enzyme family protein [bacterium]
MRSNFSFVTLFLIFFSICSCTTQEDVMYEKYGQDFGNKGGQYEGVGGVVIHIPPDSLPEGVDKVTITVFALDTPPFTNVSMPVTNTFSIFPAAIEFTKDLTVVIPYDEEEFPYLLGELDIKPYFSLDRQTFELISPESYELDVENNIVKILTRYLGNFHLGFPKELVSQDNLESEGIAEMVLIPEGTFDFGAPEGTKTEVPEDEEGMQTSEGFNKVFLSAYYIDKYEVTVQQYQLCESAGVCTEPHDVTSVLYENYYHNPVYAGFPVIWVSWNQASTFCQWAGKRLPTEAEWEKAARGESLRKYPWGSEPPADNIEATIANHSALFGDVTNSAWGDDGVSPYGVYNMAGNVAEWTNTWHNIDTYYKKHGNDIIIENPTGPAESPTTEKVIKGGSWVSLEDEITTYSRDKAFPNYRYYNLGFRCVQPVGK